jgi:hypothetical protein
MRHLALAAGGRAGPAVVVRLPLSCTLLAAGSSVRVRTCKAPPGAHCSTPTGTPASQVHTARLHPARWELVSRAAVWDELERRGVSVATVPFRGRAGQGREIDVIRLERVSDEESREVRLWPDSEELASSLRRCGAASEGSPDTRSCAPR